MEVEEEEDELGRKESEKRMSQGVGGVRTKKSWGAGEFRRRRSQGEEASSAEVGQGKRLRN